MKRKKMMRVLAMALAASMVVTAQGIPSGLTAVYAEGVTVTPLDSLATGHVYQKVTKTVDGGNKHTVACYGTDAAVEVAGGTYVKEIRVDDYNSLKSSYPNDENVTYWTVKVEGNDKYYQAVTESTIVAATGSGATTSTVDVTLPSGQYVVPGSGQGTYKVVSADALDGTNDADKIHEIEQTRLNDASKTYGAYVYYISTDDTFGSDVYDSDDASTNSYSEQSDTGSENLYSADNVSAPDYYTIVKYGKAKSPETTLPGSEKFAIGDSITDNNSALLGVRSGSTITLVCAYIPLLVKSYALTTDPAELGEEVTLTGNPGEKYTAVAVDSGTGVATWAKSTSVSDIPYYSTSDGETIKLTVVTPMKDDDAPGTYCTASYEYTDGEVKLNTEGTAVELAEPAEITEGTIISVTTGAGNEAKTDYYIDVTDKFVTAIAIDSTKVTGTQYVTTSTTETDLVDDVKLTYGINSQTEAADVLAADVTSAYTVGNTYADETAISVKKIGGTTKYMYVPGYTSTGAAIVIDSASKAAVLNGVDLTASTFEGVDVSNAKYNVKTINTPSVSVAVNTATEQEKEGTTAVYLTTDAPKAAATVDAAGASTLEGYTWKYDWSDVVGADDAAADKAGEGAKNLEVAPTEYTIDTTQGLHTITLTAKLVNSSNDVKASKTSEAVSVYVLAEDSAASVEFADSYTYTGSAIADPTVNTSKNQTYNIYYYTDANKTPASKLSSNPKDAGTYYYTVAIDRDLENGLAAKELTGTITIGTKEISVDAGSDIVNAYLAEETEAKENTHTVNLNDILSKSAAGAEATASTVTVSEDGAFAGTEGKSVFGEIKYDPEKCDLTYTLNSGATYGESDTITGKLITKNYEITVTYKVEIAAEGTTVVTPTLNETISDYYYGEQDENHDPTSEIVEEADSDGTYTFTYQLIGSNDTLEKFPTTPGTYNVTVKYTATNTVGKANTTITIKKKPVTITITNPTASIVEGDTLPEITFNAVAGDGVALTQTTIDALKEKMTYTKGDGGTVAEASVKDTPAEYTISVDKAALEENYELTVTDANLTVKKILNLTANAVESTAGATPKYTYTLTDKGTLATNLPTDATVKYTITNSKGTVVSGNPTVPGEYTITPSIDYTACAAGTDALYKVNVTTAKLNVSKATLTIKVDDATYYLGQSAAMVYSYKAMNGDDEVTLTSPTVVYKVTNGTDENEVDLTNAKEKDTYTITATVNLTDEADLAAYDISGTVTTGILTVKAARTKVTVSANSGSVNVNGTFTPVITVKDSDDETLENVTTSYIIYKQGDTTKASVALATALATTGTYIIEPSVVDTDTYEATPVTGTLTVSAASTYNPSSSNNNSNSSTGTATTYTVKENTDGSKTIVDESGKAVTSSKVTATDGKSYVTDKDGKVVTDSKVTTADGKTYITDKDGVVQTGKVAFEGKQYITGSDGAILTDQVAETPSGNKVYVDENGAIVKDKTITGSDGKRYLATKSGKLATDGFYITPSGNKVYATASGALKTGKVFTVHGKKYYAKASGAIATTGFTKTASGNTVYATKSGAIKVNKAFKASNGKKYVADKNGKIVKGKKITIGNKIYTTNKKGVITKVTTKKK